MKKIMSTNYSDTAFNIGTLLLRAVFGLALCLNHGFVKLTNFNELQHTFSDPLHIGHRWSLMLSIFAEGFCSLLVVLGLFTRIAACVVIINLAVAFFIVQKGQSFKQTELTLVFLTGFAFLLLAGPGRYSVDAMAGK